MRVFHGNTENKYVKQPVGVCHEHMNIRIQQSHAIYAERQQDKEKNKCYNTTDGTPFLVERDYAHE